MFKLPSESNYRGGANLPGLVDIFDPIPGTYHYNPTADWDLIYVEMWGAGGTGACRTTTGNASGGGGGEYISFWLTRAQYDALNSDTVIVGASGTAPVVNGNGVNGGDSSAFGLATAQGGLAGTSAVATVAAAAGAGGDSLNLGFPLNGTTANFNAFYSASGGNVTGPGAANGGGNTRHGGAGGGGIGLSGTNTGGLSDFGGDGGAGVTGGVAAGAGQLPGGGGGGGRNGSVAGAGGAGRVRIMAYKLPYNSDSGMR